MRAEGRRRMRPRDHLLPEDLSLEFPVTGITALADLPALDGQELGLGGRHCRSLSAPDEESESASWDVSSQASQNQTLKQSLQQWRSKMKKSHIKDKKKQVINDRQAALEKDVRAVMHIIGFRRLSGDQ
jgi:small-conductance mechanosensitive channel